MYERISNITSFISLTVVSIPSAIGEASLGLWIPTALIRISLASLCAVSKKIGVILSKRKKNVENKLLAFKNGKIEIKVLSDKAVNDGHISFEEYEEFLKLLKPLKIEFTTLYFNII